MEAVPKSSQVIRLLAREEEAKPWAGLQKLPPLWAEDDGVAVVTQRVSESCPLLEAGGGSSLCIPRELLPRSWNATRDLHRPQQLLPTPAGTNESGKDKKELSRKELRKEEVRREEFRKGREEKGRKEKGRVRKGGERRKKLRRKAAQPGPSLEFRTGWPWETGSGTSRS